MLTRSQAFPVDILLKILGGYTFTLMDKISKEFAIIKSILIEGTVQDGIVQINARCGATDRKYMQLGIIETRTLLFVANTYSDKIFKKHVGMFEALWYGMVYNYVPQHIEIWHPCKCSRCNRMLHEPRSIERGIGPGCEKLAKEA
jgi:hypothetical protein